MDTRSLCGPQKIIVKEHRRQTKVEIAVNVNKEWRTRGQLSSHKRVMERLNEQKLTQRFTAVHLFIVTIVKEEVQLYGGPTAPNGSVKRLTEPAVVSTFGLNEQASFPVGYSKLCPADM